jgi:hypothetical protein
VQSRLKRRGATEHSDARSTQTALGTKNERKRALWIVDMAWVVSLSGKTNIGEVVPSGLN